MASDKTISAKQALYEFLDIINANSIAGARETHGQRVTAVDTALLFSGGLTFHWERGWASEASICAEYVADMKQSRASNKTIGRYTFTVAWSASHRNVVAASAALILYRQVTELALMLQAHADSMKPVVFERE